MHRPEHIEIPATVLAAALAPRQPGTPDPSPQVPGQTAILVAVAPPSALSNYDDDAGGSGDGG